MKSIFNKNIKKYYIIILLFIIGLSLLLTNNINNFLLNIESFKGIQKYKDNKLTQISCKDQKNIAKTFEKNKTYPNSECYTGKTTSDEEKKQAINSVSSFTDKINLIKKPINNLADNLQSFRNIENFNNRKIDACSKCDDQTSISNSGAAISNTSCEALCELNSLNL